MARGTVVVGVEGQVIATVGNLSCSMGRVIHDGPQVRIEDGNFRTPWYWSVRDACNYAAMEWGPQPCDEWYTIDLYTFAHLREA